MIVIIANKLKELIENSEVMRTDHKCATGNYSSSDCIRTIQTQGLKVDYLVLDITALRDSFEISCWKQFKEFFDPSKTIILLEGTKSYSNAGFLSMLVTMGFYNFTKMPDDIIRLIKTPNTYQNVSKYQKLAMSQEEKKEQAETKVEEYYRRIEETQNMMQDYVKKHQSGEEEELTSPKKLGFQIKTGLLVLPILTFFSTFLFYLLELAVSAKVAPVGDHVGEYLYTPLANTIFTPLMIIGLFISIFIFSIYYIYLNAKIKKLQMTRGKFIIIPFAIYILIMFGEYYLVGILEHIYKWMTFISIADKSYLYQDLYAYSRWIATAVIFWFYFMTLVNNSKTLKFEKDLSQSFTFFEKIWVLVMIFMLGFPVLNQVLIAFNFHNATISDFYENTSTMIIASVIELGLMGLIIYQSKFYKEKTYRILSEEDLQNEL